MTLLMALGVVCGAIWLVCRAAAWLPEYYAREERAWIAAVQNVAHESEIQHPEPQRIGVLWRDFFAAVPPCNRWTLIATLAIGFVATSLWLNMLPGWAMIAWFVYACGLILLALVDQQTKLLPDILTIPLLWLGLLVQLFPETATFGLELAVIGAVLGYVPLWLLAQAYRLIRGRDGLGMGDLKLLAAMGAWSGPWVLPQVIFVAALLAILGFLLERLLRHRRGGLQEERPFGPWLILAYGLIVLAPISGML